MTLERSLDHTARAFVRSLRAERDLAANTLAAYERDLAQFSKWAGRGGVTRLEEIDRKLVRRYLANLSERRYARRSIARKASALRSLLRWAVLRGLIGANPAADVATPKLDHPLPRVLKAADASFLCELPARDSPVGSRDAAVLELLYGSGLRVGELCGLDLDLSLIHI